MATAVFSAFVYYYLYIIDSECHFGTFNRNCKTAKTEQDLKSLAVYTTKNLGFLYFLSYLHWLYHNKDDDYVFLKMWLPAE